jgi:hypothetical protein
VLEVLIEQSERQADAEAPCRDEHECYVERTSGRRMW